ncbi:MAG: type IV pilus modification protein PilV [Burkholderiales bacterium]
MTTTNRPLPQRGFSLIEVLVALLIFSFGLLGFVGLQARAIQFSVGAEDSNRAALLANDMAATMVLQNTADTTVLATQITAWQDRAASATAGLPNGAASAVSASASSATLTITWRAPSVASGAANATNRYQTQVTLP